MAELQEDCRKLVSAAVHELIRRVIERSQQAREEPIRSYGVRESRGQSAPQEPGRTVIAANDYRIGILDLHSPDTLPVEVAHVLTRAVRRARVVQASTLAKDSHPGYECTRIDCIRARSELHFEPH